MQDQNIDFRSTEQILEIQEQELQKHLRHAGQTSPFYQELFKKQNIDFSEISSLDDFHQIPLTSKKDLSENFENFLGTSRHEIVELVTTSGTISSPITVALSKKDLERLTYNESRSLQISGISNKDTILITTTLDKRFMAGMAYYLGATHIGATVIRSGIGDMSFQVENLLKFKPTVLIAVPSFAHKLGKYMLSQGLDPRQSSIEKIICIGETIRSFDLNPNNLHQKTEEIWNAKLHSTYASTEMATAFTECEFGHGGHIIPELMIVEILDDDGKPVSPGEPGEVVATPLQNDGMPLIRFKTGDISRLHYGKCECGRNTPRLGPIEGRKGQMIKYKGTTLFPDQIENVLHKSESLDHYLIELSLNELGLDHLQIHLSDNLSKESFFEIEENLKQSLRVTPELISTSTSEIIKRSQSQKSRKPRKFIDLRNSSK